MTDFVMTVAEMRYSEFLKSCVDECTQMIEWCTGQIKFCKGMSLPTDTVKATRDRNYKWRKRWQEKLDNLTPMTDIA